jgi:hypothetical protein
MGEADGRRSIVAPLRDAVEKNGHDAMVHPGALHAFDAPAMPHSTLATISGVIPRPADALAETRTFLTLASCCPVEGDLHSMLEPAVVHSKSNPTVEAGGD